MRAGIAGRIGAIVRFVRDLPGADATGPLATHAQAICLTARDALASRNLDDAPDAAPTALVPCTIDRVLDDTLANLRDAST